jgi:hypothetical protein
MEYNYEKKQIIFSIWLNLICKHLQDYKGRTTQIEAYVLEINQPNLKISDQVWRIEVMEPPM